MADTTNTTTIALVTGANAGIGKETATRLAKEHGYHVIVAGRQLAACEEVASELQSQGLKASALHIDLADDASIAAAAESVESQFGRLDVLVNNAAICLDPVKPEKLRETYAATFDINTIGTAAVTDRFQELIRKSSSPEKPSRIVFLSSGTGSLGMASTPGSKWYTFELRAYNASKAAVNSIALTYARDLRDDGVLVNCVCPGLTSTKMVNFNEYGHTTRDASQRVVELATLGPGGPTATFSDKDGPVEW
jgi:NAD(P)-dependent dehydrogenase (short-subunit alcohol dehydrogenase family)